MRVLIDYPKENNKEFCELSWLADGRQEIMEIVKGESQLQIERYL